MHLLLGVSGIPSNSDNEIVGTSDFPVNSVRVAIWRENDISASRIILLVVHRLAAKEGRVVAAENKVLG